MPDYSIDTGKKNVFSVADYVVFGLTLAISAGIGFFYAIKDRNNVNSKEYLLGGRQMSVIPVAMSLLVTFMSALTLLGTASEVYNYNTMFWWMALSYTLAILISAYLFIPFFYKLNTTSIFQYLEIRFNRATRILVVGLFTIPTLIYMAFVLYAPSLALASVTGLDLWWTVVGVGAVVTMYTSLGGLKAVLWTDTFQAVVIVVGLLAVLIEGCIVVGGFGRAWEIAYNRSRIQFDDFNVDPTSRHSFWSVVVGGTILWTSQYGVNQVQVQRALSCPTVKKAQLALLVNLPGLVFILSVCCMIGIVMYAFYADCHPLKFNGLIFSTDQLLPLFVMDVLAGLPGLPGIFVSCIFSGSLSTISSGLNAMSAIIPVDVIQPFCCKTMSDRSYTILSKVIVFIVGGVTIALAYAVSLMGNFLQATIAVTSALGGPVFGVFVLGIFFPHANSAGAIAGMLFSTAFMMWICIGAFANMAFNARPSPIFTHGCNWNVTTTMAPLTTAMVSATSVMSSTSDMPSTNTSTQLGSPGNTDSSDPFYDMYTVSYLYYMSIAMAVTVIVGLVVSFITGKTDPRKLDPRLIIPIFDKVSPCLPEAVLRTLRCGLIHRGKYDVPDKPTDFQISVTAELEKQSYSNEESKFGHGVSEYNTRV